MLTRLLLISTLVASTSTLANESLCDINIQKEIDSTGTKYSSILNIDSNKQTFSNILKFLNNDGMTIVHHNREYGIISTTQSVTGSSRSASFNITFDKPNGKSDMHLTFSTAAGMVSKDLDVKKYFCTVYQAV